MQVIRKLREGANVGDWNYICGMSDFHYGAKDCDENAIKRDLEQAADHKARIKAPIRPPG